MANKKYVDENGLAYFWSQLKLLFNNKVDKVTGKGLSSNDYTNNEKTKLAGIAAGAEVNQNAFTKVTVGETQLVADQKQDILTLTAGNNVTLTPNANTDTVTIAATDTTYSEATTSAAGLMSADDKTKLNGIETGAQVNTVTGVKGSSESTYRTGNINITKANIGLSNVGNFKAVSTAANQGLTDTEKANARTNIGAGTGNGTITGVSVNGTSVATSGVANITSLPASILSGAIPSAVTATTQTAGNNSTKIATTAFVKTAVDNAIGSITQIEYRVVQTLPSTGEAGVIYLVPHSHGTQDIYDEYIWITSTSTFEKIGSTDIDLSDYVTELELETELDNYVSKNGDSIDGPLIFTDDNATIILKSEDPTYDPATARVGVIELWHDHFAKFTIECRNAVNPNDTTQGYKYWFTKDGYFRKADYRGNNSDIAVWRSDLASYAQLSANNNFTGSNSFSGSSVTFTTDTLFNGQNDFSNGLNSHSVIYATGMVNVFDDISSPTRYVAIVTKDTSAGVNHSGFITYGDATTEGLYIDDNLILTTGNMIAITNAEIDTILAS